jgi:hypothetical protein
LTLMITSIALRSPILMSVKYSSGRTSILWGSIAAKNSGVNNSRNSRKKTVSSCLKSWSWSILLLTEVFRLSEMALSLHQD